MSVQVSYKKQATLGIIVLVILLLVIEGTANVWWLTQSNCEFEQNEIFQNFDEVEKRQLCLDFYNIQISGDEIIPNQSTNSITINSLGFRGSEFSEIKSPDTYRIFMVGGSTMFGAGATSDETTIPGYLQNLLNEKDFEFNIEVINSGIQGADSDSELKLIKQKLVHYHPDLVIVYDGWNDLRANNAATEIKENWETMCDFGEENNFDVIISLQPIAGFGSKVLTKQELEYVNTGTNYANHPLIQSSSIYQDYGKDLSVIKACTEALDLRDVFDYVDEPIYWDQGHVSDRGNSILAKSLLNVVSSTVSENYEFSVFEIEKNIKKTSSIYDNREIVVAVELLSNEIHNKKVKISTYDNTNQEDAQNVTYFLTISKNNENLLREYFFTKDGILILDVFPEDSDEVYVMGERQYDHNAYIVPELTPLQVTGPIFSTDGIYSFDTELRTIDNVDNWVFTLSDFHSEINIEKDNTFQETLEENKPSLQISNLLREILSYYKTPMLFNEIFN